MNVANKIVVVQKTFVPVVFFEVLKSFVNTCFSCYQQIGHFFLIWHKQTPSFTLLIAAPSIIFNQSFVTNLSL